MQRTFLIGFLFLSLAGLGSAQQHGGYGGGSGHGGGFAPVGSVGRAPVIAPFGRSNLNFNGSSVYARSYLGARRGIFAYPIYIGGLSGDYYPGYTDPSLGSGFAPGADYPPAPAAPPVVINQYFGQPGGPGPQDDSNLQQYSDPNRPAQMEAPQPAPEPRTYLIAFKDHSVYSALAYWVEDHTLHYVTPQNTHNQADVTLVDLDFTKKLNTDRNMPFSLTPPQH